MSWISDVREELKALDTSKLKLRKFGVSVGIVILLIGLWFYYQHPGALLIYIITGIGLLLLLGGVLLPAGLSRIYKIWMGFAFAIGWIISRLLLAILFYFVVTPIGLIARLVNKKFMDLDMKNRRDSYWVTKINSGNIDYEKMY